MTYQIKKNTEGHGYNVIEKGTDIFLANGIPLDEANKICWRNKDPKIRYQIVANSWATKYELTWYIEQGVDVMPNGFPTIEEARLEIITNLQEVCLNNDYAIHPNPEGDFSIIDTFTGEEVDYSISEDEASHPFPWELA